MQLKNKFGQGYQLDLKLKNFYGAVEQSVSSALRPPPLLIRCMWPNADGNASLSRVGRRRSPRHSLPGKGIWRTACNTTLKRRSVCSPARTPRCSSAGCCCWRPARRPATGYSSFSSSGVT